MKCKLPLLAILTSAISAIPSAIFATSGLVSMNEPPRAISTMNVEMVRVSYLESTGTQYIDTGVKAPSANNPLSFKATLCTRSVASSSVTFFGAYGGSAAFDNVIGTGSGSDMSITFNDGLQYSFGTSVTAGQEFSVEGRYEYSRGGIRYFYRIPSSSYDSIFLRTGTPTPSQLNWYVFARNCNGTADQFSSIRLSSLTIYDGSMKCVRHFVPVRVGKTGYLYDTVNGHIYANKGSGEFLIGSDITEHEYLDAPSGSYTKLGIRSYRAFTELGMLNTDVKYVYTGGVTSWDQTLFGSENQSGSSTWNMEWIRMETSPKWITQVSFGKVGEFYAGTGCVTRVVTQQDNESAMTFSWQREDGPMRSNTVYIDGSLNNLEWYLFGRNNDGTADKMEAWRLYHLKVTDYDKNVQGWFVPAECNGTNYVWDKWNNRLLSPVDTTMSYAVGPTVTNAVFKEVEYLQSDGNQYVRLGTSTYGRSTTRKAYPIEITFTCDDTTGTQTLVGATDGSDSSQIQVVNGDLQIRNGAVLSGALTVTAGTKYDLWMLYLDDTTMGIYVATNNTTFYSGSASVTSETCDREWYMFARRTNNGTDTPFNGKIYNFTIYDSDFTSILHEYVAKQIGTRGYFFDAKGEKLLQNAGSGDFTVGPDSEEVRVEYLVSTGTQWINLGIKADSTAASSFIPYEVKFMQEGIFGDTIQNGVYSILGAETRIGSSAWTCEWLRFNNWELSLQFENGGFLHTSLTDIFQPMTVKVEKYSSTQLKYTLNDTVSYLNLENIITGNTWYLFAKHNRDLDGTEEAQEIQRMRIYYLKTYAQDGTTLLHHWVPYRKGNVSYMKDITSGSNYYNQGTGEFECGPDVR